MAVYDILPDTDLKDVDIVATLNDNGGTVDFEKESWYKKSANTNMWSRFKPVPHSKLQIDGESRWKGEDGKCGLTIPTYSSLTTLRTALANGTAMWSYKPLAENPALPLRMGDFRGYNPKARNPIGELFDEYVLMSNGVGYEFDIQVDVLVGSGSEESEHNLILGDISVDGTNLTDMYLGIYMIPSSGSGYIFGTSDSKIGTSDSISMVMQGSSATKGEYTAYMFLATTPQVGSEAPGTFISLNKEGKKVNIILPESLYQIEVNGVWNTSGTSFEYEVVVTNNNVTSVTFTNLMLYLVRSKSYDGLLDKEEQERSYSLTSSETIEPGGTQRYTGQKTYSRSDDYFYGLYVGVSVPALSTSVTPLEENPDIPEL